MIDKNEWQALKDHQQCIAAIHMQQWFDENPDRFRHFSIQTENILFDYSKNRITAETIQLLCQLARALNLKEKIDSLFAGKLLNSTEKKPALHTALRNQKNHPVYVHGKDVMPDVNSVLEKMRTLVEKIHQQKWLGHTGKPIRDIINIGIGGSYLGSRMATHALSDFAKSNLRCHFISNIDSAHLHEVLNQIDPERALFIISSKSFTTLETMTNAKTIRLWLQQKLNSTQLSSHFLAVTANAKKAEEFGIPQEQIFPMWEWVGGRYSVWSAVGLPLAILIGMENFSEFLAGAHAMDNHFLHADFENNMPVIMALLGIWYINFFDAKSHAIIPYTHHLNYFQEHLQQADMESNGKNISHHGNEVNYATGPIIWGEQGCNGQHAFHQLLHQGKHLVPVDFILVAKSAKTFGPHHEILVASGLSQAQALLQGKSYQSAFGELIAEGFSTDDAAFLASHKTIPGNRPSNTLFVNEMTPYNLGSLLALYEHKIFVQGAIWNINSFDQWGVELGKQLLPKILNNLKNSENSSTENPSISQDGSTQGLIEHFKKIRDISCEK
jgi:glucose-6-phosphate isomerase